MFEHVHLPAPRAANVFHQAMSRIGLHLVGPGQEECGRQQAAIIKAQSGLIKEIDHRFGSFEHFVSERFVDLEDRVGASL